MDSAETPGRWQRRRSCRGLAGTGYLRHPARAEPHWAKVVMSAILASPWTTWGIAGAATAGVIIRPFSWPEFIWAVSGAVLLVALGLLTPADALSGVTKGTDVYLFLTGMMLLSELARQEGLFDWPAARAVRMPNGSAMHLFTLVFTVGTVVTVFLSNDATAVVLTPAVAAAANTAKADKKLPYLFICAFIANAASFVLPISNPANLVIYGSRMPSLLQWLPRYALPRCSPSLPPMSCCAGASALIFVRRSRRTSRCRSCRPPARWRLSASR